MTATKTGVRPADTLHFLHDGAPALSTSEPGSLIPMTVQPGRGTTVTLTRNMIENATDRLGSCWLDLADDEPAQVERWGRVMFRRGPWPEGVDTFERGSVAAMVERDRLRHAASAIADEGERMRALRDIDARLGRPRGQTSTWIKGDEERRRDRDAERRLDRGRIDEDDDDA